MHLYAAEYCCAEYQKYHFVAESKLKLVLVLKYALKIRAIIIL